MMGNKLLGLFAGLEKMAKQNSRVLLTGTAIVGVITTAYSAYKAGLRAEKILEQHRQDMEDCYPDDREAKTEVMKDTAKKMIPTVAPAVIMGGVTIACIAGTHSVSSRKIAALSAAYSLSENTVRNLNEKMNEMLGEKKARSIKDAIMKDKLKADSEKDKKVFAGDQVVIPGDGTVLCKDLYSGRLFYSTAEKIKQAIAKCSYDIVSDMYISLNDFYSEIDSPQLQPIPMGEDLGWNIEDTMSGKLPITLTALLTDDNKPCLCLDYDISVRDDLRSLR